MGLTLLESLREIRDESKSVYPLQKQLMNRHNHTQRNAPAGKYRHDTELTFPLRDGEREVPQEFEIFQQAVVVVKDVTDLYRIPFLGGRGETRSETRFHDDSYHKVGSCNIQKNTRPRRCLKND